MALSSNSKLIARNVAAVRRFAVPGSLTATVAGNPVSTRLESAIGNCFPGLECDLRNLERRFFPFLEVDIVNNVIAVAAIDRDAVARANASGELGAADAATYGQLADLLAAGHAVLIANLSGTFGPLGALNIDLDLPELAQRPESQGNLGIPSVGAGRRPPDAWTAVRLLTEGTNVTAEFVTDGPTGPGPLRLTAPRARYIDDNGTLSAAFLPGELSQSLCSPWTHDFRDCGCFYWASNHPDIVQPALPTGALPGEPWNAAVAWERPDRTIGPNPPPKATERTPAELRHYEINNRWQELHFVVGRREITAPFSQSPVVGRPFANLSELVAFLNYAAGVELAVAQEYLAAAYSLKADSDPVLAGRPELANDIKAARAEFMRIAIGEMRHIRVVNDVLRGLTGTNFLPALRVASEVPHRDPGRFRAVMARAATSAVIDDFVQIEAQSAGVDGLYNDILATLQFPPADVEPLVTDEWRQAIRSVIAEGEDHFETFLSIKEWLGGHAENDYLRSTTLSPPPPGQPEHTALQTAYRQVLEDLFTGYKKGRFLGATEINAARDFMVAAAGISTKAEAVASRNFLVVFETPNDPRFVAVDPPTRLTS